MKNKVSKSKSPKVQEPTPKPLNPSTLEPLKEGWRWVRLGEVCKFEYGTGLPERDRLAGNVSVFGSNGIVGYHNTSITQGPTIIIGRKGSIGKINYSKVSCWPIDTTYYIDGSKTSCDIYWLYWLLNWLRLDVLNKATGVPGLNRNDAYNQSIPLPPFEEEKRISAKLQKHIQEVERAKNACKKQLEAAKALPAAYLREVFESEEAKKWERKRLGELCEIKGGKRLPRGYEFAKEKTPYPYIRVVDMQDGSIKMHDLKYLTPEIRNTISKYTISVDNVYISIAGTIGLVGTIPHELDGSNLTENAAKLIIKDKTILKRDYLWLFLFSDIGQQLIKERINLVGQPKLALFRIKTIPIPLPNPLIQEHIASEIKEKMARVENLQSKIYNLRSTINNPP